MPGQFQHNVTCTFIHMTLSEFKCPRAWSKLQKKRSSFLPKHGIADPIMILVESTQKKQFDVGTIYLFITILLCSML